MNKERNKLKLNIDQYDQLTELVVHANLSLLTDTVMEHLCDIIEERVLKFDLGTRSDRELTIEKARAEGARKLQLELRTYLANFKAAAFNEKRLKR